MNQLHSDIPRFSIIVAIIFFAIAGVLGLYMRLAFVFDMPEWIQYRNIQHAHSHVALLGWLFAIYYIIIIKVFQLGWNNFAKLYWSIQGAVLGMLLTFPITGYAGLSIAFSTLHILLTYAFVYQAARRLRVTQHGLLPTLFLRASLFLLVLSTVGTWALGPIISVGLKGSAWYYASIQFYLHFQFNGWLTFAVLAVLFCHMRSHHVSIRNRSGLLFFWTLIVGTIMTYALAITWSTPHSALFILNSLGVLIQLAAIVMFMGLIFKARSQMKEVFSSVGYTIVFLSFIAFFLKVALQSIVVIPAMAEISYTIRNLVIGFIHLLMLGGLTLFAFTMISDSLKISISTGGIRLFILGVITSELLLFGQGIMQWQGWGFLPYYYELVACASGIIVIGIVIILIRMWKKRIS